MIEVSINSIYIYVIFYCVIVYDLIDNYYMY